MNSVAAANHITTVDRGPKEIYALDIDFDLISHLADPESVMYLRSEQVSSEILEDQLAKEVFDWQMAHIRDNEGKPATASVLEAEFPQVHVTEPETAIGDLVSRLRERYVKNAGRKILRDLARLNGETPAAMGTEMLRQARKLSLLTTARGAQFSTADIEHIEAIYAKKVLRGPGPTLGFAELDQHFHGIKGMTFLVAAPKSYKSWFTVNSVLESTIKGGRPFLYSLELPAEDTDMRIRCMAADVPFWKWERNALTNEDWKNIHLATEALLQGGSYEVVKPEPGDRDAHTLVEKAIAGGATAIYIDQLQYVENDKGTNLGSLNDTGHYWQVLSVLRDYSDELPVFVVHQFNRSVMKAKEMPEMQQAKGSAALEEIGYLVLGLWANKEMRRNNVVECGTLASRSYSYKNWHLDVQLSKGCNLGMIGEVEDEDE